MNKPDRDTDRDHWNRRYREQRRLADETTGAADTGPDHRFRPPEALTRMARHLPSTGQAIDLAGGTGGAALSYAASGLRSVLVDVSDEALGQAARRGEHTDVPLATVQLDTAGLSLGEILGAVRAELESPFDSPETPKLVSCFHYLDRNLLGSVAEDLPPGAIFMAAIATRTNLERNDHPSARFLLEPGELLELVVGSGPSRSSIDQRSLEVLHNHEGWNGAGRHEAGLVVRRLEH